MTLCAAVAFAAHLFAATTYRRDVTGTQTTGEAPGRPLRPMVPCGSPPYTKTRAPVRYRAAAGSRRCLLGPPMVVAQSDAVGSSPAGRRRLGWKPNPVLALGREGRWRWPWLLAGLAAIWLLSGLLGRAPLA